jgi:two-component system chemotaxis sensor kinase CheA
MEFLKIFLDEAAELIEKWQQIAVEMDKAGANSASWNALFRIVHTLKGSSRAVGLSEFGSYLHLLEEYISALRDGKLNLTDVAKTILSEGVDHVADWLRSVGDGNPESIKPPIGKNCEIIQSQLNVSRTHQQSEPKDVSTPEQQNIPTSTCNKTTVKSDQTLRVPASKVDSVIKQVAEISAQVTMLNYQIKQQALGTALGQMADDTIRSLRQLRDSAMGLRMESLNNFFARMEKVARDVARAQSKPISVEVIGRDIELDKVLSDRIVDPFIHVVRNAIDHGIEPESQRLKVGKQAQGKLTLTAVSDGNAVTISVADDGKGMDPEYLYQKAIQKGIIAPDTILSDAEKINLILQPGFSTAEKVTEISGRGVGMDVVATAIRELGGRLSIKSQKGAGSGFSLMIPAGLAMVESFIVEVAGQKYAIPKSDVARIVNISRQDVAELSPGGPFFKIDGSIAPLIDLGQFLAQNSESKNDDQNCLVIHTERGLAAFAVTRVAWEQEVISSQLSGSFTRICGLSGSTILANGEPSLLINLKAIAQQYFAPSSISPDRSSYAN